MRSWAPLLPTTAAQAAMWCSHPRHVTSRELQPQCSLGSTTKRQGGKRSKLEVCFGGCACCCLAAGQPYPVQQSQVATAGSWAQNHDTRVVSVQYLPQRQARQEGQGVAASTVCWQRQVGASSNQLVAAGHHHVRPRRFSLRPTRTSPEGDTVSPKWAWLCLWLWGHAS